MAKASKTKAMMAKEATLVIPINNILMREKISIMVKKVNPQMVTIRTIRTRETISIMVKEDILIVSTANTEATNNIMGKGEMTSAAKINIRGKKETNLATHISNITKRATLSMVSRAREDTKMSTAKILMSNTASRKEGKTNTIPKTRAKESGTIMDRAT